MIVVDSGASHSVCLSSTPRTWAGLAHRPTRGSRVVDGAVGSAGAGAGVRRVDLLLRGLSAESLEQVLRQVWQPQALLRLLLRSGG